MSFLSELGRTSANHGQRFKDRGTPFQAGIMHAPIADSYGNSSAWPEIETFPTENTHGHKKNTRDLTIRIPRISLPNHDVFTCMLIGMNVYQMFILFYLMKELRTKR